MEESGAFELLRAYCSRHDIKLAEVSHRSVVGLCHPAFSREEPGPLTY